MSCNWNGQIEYTSETNNWRASLVPAAAVIPAPIAYIKAAAVRKFVVEILPKAGDPPFGCETCLPMAR